MMKIGIISDTHLELLVDAADLAEYLLAGPFAEVDAILHAGDMVIPEFVDCFHPIPCYAVRGNMDESVTGVPNQRIIGFEGKRIGLIHGWGPRNGVEKRAIEAFSDHRIDCLVYGHSHYPVCRHQGDLLLFNPGSPVDKRSAPKHTVGILTIDDDGVRGQIIDLD